jgi:hypothetical protein
VWHGQVLAASAASQAAIGARVGGQGCAPPQTPVFALVVLSRQSSADSQKIKAGEMSDHPARCFWLTAPFMGIII